MDILVVGQAYVLFVVTVLKGKMTRFLASARDKKITSNAFI